MRDAPDLDISAFPKEEGTFIWSIQSNLRSIDEYLTDFECALKLFDNAVGWRSQNAENREIGHLTSRWQTIAARDGAMTIYHLGALIDGTRSSFKECPTFREKVDHTPLRDAAKKLVEDFPLYIKMRHAIGHRGELHSTREAFEKNSISGELKIPGLISQGASTKNTFIRAMMDRTLYDSFEGELISYEISQESADKLVAIRDDFMSGFQPVSRPKRY